MQKAKRYIQIMAVLLTIVLIGLLFTAFFLYRDYPEKLASASDSHAHTWKVVEYNMETKMITLECSECKQRSSSVLTGDIIQKIEISEEWENAVPATIVDASAKDATKEENEPKDTVTTETRQEPEEAESEEDATETTEPTTGRKAVIVASEGIRVNIRSGPSANTESVGKTKAGEEFMMNPESETDGWTQLADGSGWIKNTLFEWLEE